MLYNIHNTRQEKKNEIINPLKSIFVARVRAPILALSISVASKWLQKKKKIKKILKNQHTQSTCMYAVYTGGIWLVRRRFVSSFDQKTVYNDD